MNVVNNLTQLIVLHVEASIYNSIITMITMEQTINSTVSTPSTP